MWIANFFIAASLTMILPFLSLYIETFGEFTDDYVQKWSGLVFGVTFLTAFIFSPIWGRYGDQKGRKRVLIILGYGVAVCVFLMGFVNSVHLLFVLRLFMGLFAGFVSMAQALIAAQTPKEIAGRTLGTLQTGSVTGALLGPLIGGFLADSVGFTYTFLITSFTTAIAATFVLGIKEVRVDKKGKNEKSYTSKEVLRYIFSTPMMLMVMVVSTIIHAANFAISPLLALYVNEFHGAANLAFLSGLAFSATGLGNLIFTRQWGKLGDRIGYEKVLFILLLLCALIFLPQAFITNIWQLVILRFLLGFAFGGIIPCRTAYIRQKAPASIQGEVLGYNTSFRFLGNVIGPVIGGVLSAYLGISSVFFLTSGLFLLSAVLLWMAYQKDIHEVVKQVESSNG